MAKVGVWVAEVEHLNYSFFDCINDYIIVYILGVLRTPIH